MEEDVDVSYVSTLKRRSGQVVIAFASTRHMESRTLFWWPERNDVMRRKYVPVSCNEQMGILCSIFWWVWIQFRAFSFRVYFGCNLR